jgi:hypothetical protein
MRTLEPTGNRRKDSHFVAILQRRLSVYFFTIEPHSTCSKHLSKSTAIALNGRIEESPD